MAKAKNLKLALLAVTLVYLQNVLKQGFAGKKWFSAPTSV